MANIQVLGTAGLLVVLVPAASIAMPPQEAEVKSCKAITDDIERLRCFDGLFWRACEPTKIPRRKASEKASRRKAGELVN